MNKRKSWKRVSAARIARLSAGQARDIIHAVNARGATIFHPELKELTGGFVSQSINFHVLRKLGQRAGLVK